ncbi:RNA polymerase-associated CTR9-like protein [Chlorella sorokiniana]|uniref:RNA polymerase-associated CTR9-like protein n=1 Tax=Chlorella sorokiniana TaxID=3076 RepID=A0A2P6U592_CHLSO|nr:RNA polymerase-associated CTR9-like protein [Chlorella sorokiniana]|eukprot:PRW61484.1 RNA polymerase-associated CTR9-like protein [Chlorella sorokiniana]
MALVLPLNGVSLRLDPGSVSLDDLLRALRADGGAPAAAWLAAAHHLLACGRERDFEAVLSEAAEREPAPGARPPAVFPHVQALCSLAEFSAQQAAGERERRRRQELLMRATDLCHRAQRLSLEEQLPELVLGHVALVKGDTAGARKGFEKALRMRCNGRSSIAAQLALAALHFNQRNYQEALKLYKAALRACPTAPPEVRLGIAACSLKMGSTGTAELAYRRVLDMAPDCTPALLGLAVLKLHVSSDEQGVREGSQLLAEAFEQDPENPFVLLLLAHFCLRQGYADKARQLAETVQAHGGSAAMQAEAYTLLGRACHALGQLNDAYRYYQQATHLDSKLTLPRLGLAQLNVLQNEAVNAASLLESVLLDAPQWIDALEMLGRVYPKAAHKSSRQARDVVPQFKEAAQARPRNAHIWELLGDLLASLEPAGALKAYDKAIEIRRKAAAAAKGGSTEDGGADAGQLSARLLNNAAILHLRAGDAQKAFELMAQAVTLGYNLARVKEACGDLKSAEAEYKELLRQFPQYGDCCLRLACIAKARGDTKEALRWAEQATEIRAYAADALALQAGLHLEKRDYHHAKQVLDRLLEAEDGRKHETFAKLAMANLHAYSAPSSRKTDKDKLRAEVHYSHAMELYRRVLEKDEGCISAANGVGCILAEVGNMTAAKEVFLQVQEASAASSGFWRMPDAWVNLANVYLAQEQYVPAIQMYSNALRKFYDNRSAMVMLYLARAQYDADHLPEAKRTLTKALHLAPTDHQLRFNVALTLQEWAVRTLQRGKEGDPGRLPAVLRAMKELREAHRFFTYLHGLGKASGLNPEILKHHINFVAKTHEDARVPLEKAQQKVAEAAEKEQRLRERAEKDKERRELEEEQRQILEAAARRKLEEEAQRQAEKLQNLQQQWRNAAVMEKAVAKGDAAAVAKKAAEDARAAQEAQVDALFASDEEDEDYNPEAMDAEFPDEPPRGVGGAAGGAAGAGGQYDDLEDDFELDDDDLFGEGEEGGAAAGGKDAHTSGGGGGSAPPPRKKAKHRAVMDEDEDEDE